MLQGYCRRFEIKPTAYDVLTCFIQYSASIEESMVSESKLKSQASRRLSEHSHISSGPIPKNINDGKIEHIFIVMM